MDKQTLKAEKRNLVGRKVKRLRNEGLLPANVYGRDVKSLAIQVPIKEFEKVFAKTGETGLVELSVDSEKRPVLIHNVQVDPVSGKLLHTDLLQVNLKQKVSAEVPVDLVGESPVEKQGLGTVVQYIKELRVEALPTDLPDKFDVDISQLTEVEQMIQVGDIKIDKAKIEVEAGDDEIIVKVEPPKEEKEEVVVPAEGEEAKPEGEVVGEEGTKTQESETKEDVQKTQEN